MTPVVLVAGAPAAGVSTLVSALADRLADVEVVEECDGEIAVAVLAVSAVAPPAPSDCAVLDDAVARANEVVGAVTKVDAHRRWRDVFAEVSARYRDIRWVATAAGPQLGPPDVAALVDAVNAALRAEPVREVARIRHLRSCRSALVRDHRTTRPGSSALRTGLQGERLALGAYTRERCAGLRAEFRGVAAGMPRRSAAVVQQRLREAADALVTDVDERVDHRLAGLARELGVAALEPAPLPSAPQWDGPPEVSRRAERGLTLALGAGFGLGIAVAAGRVFAALAPWLSVAAQAAGALIGVLLTAWLVSTRELLHDRAVVDRWVCDVVSALRGHADDRVATRLLDADVHFGAALAARAARESDGLTRRIALIDAELRALRDRLRPT